MKSKAKSLILTGLILFIAFVSILVYREGSLPVDKQNPKTVDFIVKKGQSLTTIINDLKEQGLIRNRIVFFIVVKQLGIEKNIQAGDFRLSTQMNAREIARQLTRGSTDQWVTIIEGLRKEEVADIVSKQLPITAIDFIDKAQEGYLFPDTYSFPKDATAEKVIEIMRNNFNKKFTPELRAKGTKLDLTENQIVTLASVVEREALYDEDRVRVASALLARIKKGAPLQVDATVQYALGYQDDQKTWWKREVSLDDLKIKSPYNTYVNPGLPPGPICNPGLASLEAVVNGDPNTPYVFYVSDKQGHLHFASTSEGHQQNINKYLQ